MKGDRKIIDILNQALKAEADELWRLRRPEVVAALSAAAAEGDRSENADYTENKRRLRQIDRRIRFLTKLFEVAERIEYNPAQEGKVYFGAWCELENDAGDSLRFRIVGDEEVYAEKDYISLRSPMARACLGKELDDEVVVRTPEGEKYWYVVAIEYQQTAAEDTTDVSAPM